MTRAFTRCLAVAFFTFSRFCHWRTGTKLSAQTSPFSAKRSSTSWALSSFGTPVRNFKKLAPRRASSRYMRSSSPSRLSVPFGSGASQSMSSYRQKQRFPSGVIRQK